MSNSVFQSVIVQLRDVSDRVFGVYGQPESIQNFQGLRKVIEKSGENRH